MNIGALDKIANIQSRIGEIEQKISGFSNVFQAELQNAASADAAVATETAAVDTTATANQTDYATLSALLSRDSSLNRLLVNTTDAANTTSSLLGSTLQQALLGNTDVSSAIETYLKNNDYTGMSSVSNVLGTTNQTTDTLNLSTILQSLVGQTTDKQK